MAIAPFFARQSMSGGKKGKPPMKNGKMPKGKKMADKKKMPAKKKKGYMKKK